MKAALCAVVVAAGLYVAVMIRAGEAPSTPAVSGPVAEPLGRAGGSTVRLEYPASVSTETGEAASTAATNKVAQKPDLFSKFASGSSADEDSAATTENRPRRLPAVAAAKPSAMETADETQPTAAENNPLRTAGAPPAAEQASSRQPIHAAFRQLSDPIPSSPVPVTEPSGAAPTEPSGQPLAPDRSPTSLPPSDMPSVQVDGGQPHTTSPSIVVHPHMHPSAIVMGEGAMPPPGYFGGGRVPKSECGYCSPAPAFGCTTCQSVRQGGPGCASGNCGPDGTCTTCGGKVGCTGDGCGGDCGDGCAGGCGGGCGHKGRRGDGCEGGRPSRWVNGNGLPIAGTPAYGSFALERLACCMCQPYPDCSNGCVDFCHSWIFHEDCCWLTSNHKCCNEGCPESPYGGCSNGSGCGCGCAECVPPPDIYFTADAIIFTRNNQALNQPVVTESGSGATLLSTGDFDFAHEVGPSFVLGYRPTPWDAWELSYFGLLDWDSSQSLTGAGDLNLPGELGAALDLNFADAVAMDLTYSSVIHNAEANYLWTYGNFMWLAGFRYFNLAEDFDITATGPLGSTTYNVATQNNLYGGQLGVRWRAGWQRLNWDVTGKAGAFGNAAEQEQIVANAGEQPIRDASASAGQWAFVGDVGVNLTYRLGKCWSVRGGYNAMWVEGVALAPNQLDFTDTLDSGTALHHNGGVFFHGAHAGIGCRW